MQISDTEKLGVSFLARRSGDFAAGIPIKKRPFSFARPSSPPAQLPPPPRGGHDTARKEPDVLEQDASQVDACFQTASETALAIKGYSGKSKEKLMVKGRIDISTKGKELPLLNSQVESEMAASAAGSGTSNVKELNLDDKCALHTVLGSSQLSSALKEQVFAKPKDEVKILSSDTGAFHSASNMEFQSIIKGPFEASVDGQNMQGSSYLRQEEVEYFSSSFNSTEGLFNEENMDRDAELKTDSMHLSVDRSKWDLNTTMDTWDISTNDSLINIRTAEQVGLEHHGMTEENLNLDYVQMHLRDSNITNWNDGRSMSLESEHKFARSNSCTTVNELNNSEALLDLQLKPSFIAEQILNFGATYGEENSVRGMPTLRLSAKPISSIDNSNLTTCGAVKSEPCDYYSNKDRRKVEMSSLKSVSFEHIKSEPIEGSVHECSKPTFSDNLRSACSKLVKSKPVENLSQAYPEGVEGNLSGLGKHTRTLASSVTELSQDVSASVIKALNLISESIRVSTQQYASEVVGKALNLVPKVHTLNSNKSYRGEAMPTSTGILHDRTGTDSEFSHMALKSLISEDKNLNSVKGACEVAGLSTESLQPHVSDGNKHLNVDSTAEGVAQMGFLDGTSHCLSVLLPQEKLNGKNHILAVVLPAEKLNADSYGNGEVIESSNMDVSEDDKQGSSHGLLGIITQVRSDDHYEDGKARNLALNAASGGSCEQKHAIKAADSIPPSLMSISHLDEKGCKIAKIDKLNKGYVTLTSASDLSNDKNISTDANVPGFSDAGGLTAASGERRLLNITHKMPQNLLKKDKESKSERSPGAKATVEHGEGQHGGQQEYSGGSDQSHSKHSVLSKSKSLRNGDTMKHANDLARGSHSQKCNTNSAHQKPKFISHRLIASRSVRTRDKSPRQERLHSQGSKDDKPSDSSRRFENDRNLHRVARESGSDLVHIGRRGDNQLDTLHDDRIPHLIHGPGQGSNATGIQIPRPREAQGVGNASRVTRKPTNDELQHLLRMPFRRQSPGRQAQVPLNIPMVYHPIKNASPARCIDRNVADFAALNHEQKLTRTMPDEVIDPRMLARPLPSHERADGFFIHGQRRSLSPVLCRVHPLCMPCSCLESSPRGQTHLPSQWTPPHQLPCLPGDILVRRHMINTMPQREHEFPRPVRGAEMGIQRFDLIGRREFAQEECFRPLLVGQAHEIAGEECNDDKTYCGRQGLVRSTQQRLGPPGISRENFHFFGEDGLPMSTRFCPQPAEEFPRRINSGDLSGGIRNQLGSMTCRPRSIEQEHNYYTHHIQGWQNSAFSDLRLKRRRF